jgi:hypothetical protein
MRRRSRTNGRLPTLFWLALAATSWGCGTSKPQPLTGTGGAGGSGSGATTVGLDQPREFPRPPTGGLPSELLPPGLRR